MRKTLREKPCDRLLLIRYYTEKFIRQKLNFKNPISGIWKPVDDYIDYIHSSARFYELGEEGVYKVIHYSEAMNIPEQGFSAERLF